MSMRRVTILEGMFLDIATSEDKQAVDRLYEVGNKGSAVVLMLKRVREKWVECINHKCNNMPENKIKPEEEFYLPKLRVGLFEANY